MTSYEIITYLAVFVALAVTIFWLLDTFWK